MAVVWLAVVPGAIGLYTDGQVKARASEFAASLRFARARAIEMRMPVGIAPGGANGLQDGWRVLSRAGAVLLEQPGPVRVRVHRRSREPLAFGATGKPLQPGRRAVLFHAPDVDGATPRCVYVQPDGRVRVEAPERSSRSFCRPE